MSRMALIVLAAGALLTVAETASAQDLVRPRWNAYGSVVCPSNYNYFDGWCRPVYGYGYRDTYTRRYRRGYGGYGNDTVPPQWTSSGSAVCPSNYNYDVRINACVSVY
jgi:hypothetical protein